jgi:hypothetical protein
MYDFRAILDKEPVAIAGALRSILFIGVLAGLFVMDEKLLAAIALGAEVGLGLFVRRVSTSVSAASENEAQAFAAGADAGAAAQAQDQSLLPSHVAVEDIPDAAGEG